MDFSFVTKIITASKIDQYLLPRVSFTGFNFITPIDQASPVAQNRCDTNDLIILFASNHHIDRVEHDSIEQIIERFPGAVEYGRKQLDILSKLR
jgi:hypothetical protein